MQRALAGRPAVARRAAVAGEALARERLVHHAVHRLAAARERDQRAPGRHAGDEGLGAVDRIEHPDIFGVGALVAELLADDAVIRESSAGSACASRFRRRGRRRSPDRRCRRRPCSRRRARCGRTAGWLRRRRSRAGRRRLRNRWQSCGSWYAPFFFGCHVPTKQGIHGARVFAVDIARRGMRALPGGLPG